MVPTPAPARYNPPTKGKIEYGLPGTTLPRRAPSAIPLRPASSPRKFAMTCLGMYACTKPAIRVAETTIGMRPILGVGPCFEADLQGFFDGFWIKSITNHIHQDGGNYKSDNNIIHEDPLNHYTSQDT